MVKALHARWNHRSTCTMYNTHHEAYLVKCNRETHYPHFHVSSKQKGLVWEGEKDYMYMPIIPRNTSSHGISNVLQDFAYGWERERGNTKYKTALGRLHNKYVKQSTKVNVLSIYRCTRFLLNFCTRNYMYKKCTSHPLWKAVTNFNKGCHLYSTPPNKKACS